MEHTDVEPCARHFADSIWLGLCEEELDAVLLAYEAELNEEAKAA